MSISYTRTRFVNAYLYEQARIAPVSYESIVEKLGDPFPYLENGVSWDIAEHDPIGMQISIWSDNKDSTVWSIWGDVELAKEIFGTEIVIKLS
jgi:hypothetical protein